VNSKMNYNSLEKVITKDLLIEKYVNQRKSTSGVAAVRQERNFIGFEISPNYFKIAEKRIKKAQNQGKITDYYSRNELQNFDEKGNRKVFI